MAFLRHKPHVRIFSFGGGVQSTALLVMQATDQLKKPFDVFVFANVGDDSENPATLDYMRRYSIPYARRHGIPFITVQKTTYGEPETLYEYIYRTPRSVPIPAFMRGGAPGNRSCTRDFKILVVDRYAKQCGWSHATVGLGISLDEFTRMRDEDWHNTFGGKPVGYMKRREHPLIHQRITRNQCHAIIRDAGLPQPPKSSCWFCPFHRPNDWIEMRRTQPRLFAQAVMLEKHINAKRNAVGRDYVYLHVHLVPLDRAVPDQPLLPGFGPESTNVEMCDGYCHI
jgi:hypothetical protein